ncbi:MAG TPA: hypothetical protein VKE98_04380 [Gemmataceae bacterium]|nr:hypothetical protein [Gemmataceae bacterium]
MTACGLAFGKSLRTPSRKRGFGRRENPDMSKLAAALALIQKNADAWGVYFSPPLSDVAAASAKETFEKSFGISYPSDYELFLAISNGFGTQRGTLFDAESIQKWNEEHWHRIPILRQVEGGSVIESFPNPDPPTIEYVWIGSYGNMDMYSFHQATREYRVTNLSFEYVYGRFKRLDDFLMYLADPTIELAGST